ncbi:hypothetical protein N657DRAFT_673183 [Parathielavia appendiculata]|uniref:2EXR domain-containing protein n=1 Tax=Parathielavia appendiculata TaxID=2587402 RepID=A0AAN6TWC0_9PEZI|nr:hypothetical protein N657DRAFT_673183 [Parathielavia appendiculata]
MSTSITLQPAQGMESKPPTADTTPSFTSFPHLPLEIRFMIWELCLPRRIIQFSVLALIHHRHHHPDRNTNDNMNSRIPMVTLATLLRKHHARPCRIAQVCRESRAAVLSLRRSAEVLDLPWLGQGVWFDPRTDTVLLDCDVFERYRDIWEEVRSKLSYGSGAWPGRERGVQIGFSAPLFGWHRSRPGTADVSAQDDDVVAPAATDTEDGKFRARQREWPVVMNTVYLDVTSAEACGTGLFGLFGEEQAIFIDLHNDRQLELLKGIPRSMSGLFPIQRTIERCWTGWKAYKSQSRAVSRTLVNGRSTRQTRLPHPCYQGAAQAEEDKEKVFNP